MNNHGFCVLRLALPVPLRRLFDYLPPKGIDYKALKPGIRIRVPFQSRVLVGTLISVENATTVPHAKLKLAQEILDSQPIFSEDVFQLCRWAADYYQYALGEVLACALPALLRKGRQPVEKPAEFQASRVTDVPHRLNRAQQRAVEAMLAAKDSFKVFLLDGVTGSGKTEVYLQAMAEKLATGQQILLLVPEISLTPQTVERFRARFSVPVGAWHSGLTDQERLNVWTAARSGRVKVVIGTRSAVFMPFIRLGLIVVDEEHDTSFKQQERFRYHARDLAIIRANIDRIPIVLGSATPSLTSLLNAKRNRYALLPLPQRAGKACLPDYHLLDLRQTRVEEGLSDRLVEIMKQHLDEGNQVLLFLNRRGFAPVLYCPQCAWMAECERCDARLVYHRKPPRLQCHYCDKQKPLPDNCAQCGEAGLQLVGVGTQRLEQVLAKYFPDVPVFRIDRDNTRRKGAMQSLLQAVHIHKKAILLGTQMLAKGHHFPRVTLVGMIDADSGLFSADFRAAEQMGQLFMQTAGRAGRADNKGMVVIQTRHPEHPLLQVLIRQGYQVFAQNLLDERKMAELPPFSHLAVFHAEAYSADTARGFLEAVREKLPTGPLSVLGPVSAQVGRCKGMHRQQLLLKADNRPVLQGILKQVVTHLEQLASSYSVKWSLDVDPVA